MIINEKETLRYLGYRGNDADVNIKALIKECTEELKSISKPKGIYEIFPIERRDGYIFLKNSTLFLSGKNIHRHLINSEKSAIMATTLGIEVDKRITLYSKTDLTKSLVMDACASTAIEWFCDEIQKEIKEEAEKEGYKITNRFSPGYGDFPISIQNDLEKALKTYARIGLTVSENHLMIPRKSVTAVIGFQKNENKELNNKCDKCQEDCSYRKEDEGNE